MSGHSKWAQIKRRKGVNDTKRGALFTKIGKEISIAARSGKDPETNFRLRMAIDKAKAVNVPKDNIERAILRGAGELKDQDALLEIAYEGYGPEGVALVIEVITDNKNRTSANMKHLLNQRGGSLAGANSVLWNFERRGVIRISKENMEQAGKTQDEAELFAIDHGAEDIASEEEGITVYIAPEKFLPFKEALAEANITFSTGEIELVAKNKATISESAREKVNALIEALEDDDDVTNVFTNLA